MADNDTNGSIAIPVPAGWIDSLWKIGAIVLAIFSAGAAFQLAALV